MPFFEKNLKTLRQKNPRLAAKLYDCPIGGDIQVIEARSGEKIPVVDGRALHSNYHPAEEGRRIVTGQSLANPGAMIVLGLGFGYHIDALLGRASVPLAVVECRLDILRSAMEHRDLERLLCHSDIFCGSAPGSVLTDDRIADSLLAGTCEIVSHDPSVRLAPEYYAAVKAQLQRGLGRTALSRLRVLVVSPLFGGSYSIARYAAAGLHQIGCEAAFLDLAPFYQASRYMDDSLKDTAVQEGMAGLFHRLLCEFIYCKIRQIQPELVFFLAQAPVSVELLKKLQSGNVRTAFWFVENHRLFPYWKELSPYCDNFFTIQRGEFFSKLDAIGAFNHFYLPVACDPSVHRPLVLNPEERARFGSDISVAGFGYYNRLHMLQGLTDFALKLWGPSWQRAPALVPFIQDGGIEFDVESMVKIYNASAININLHSSTHSTGVEPGGDFVNPRTFELAGCGAFQLTDERAELAELFAIGNEIVTFNDLETLRENARYFLERAGQRKEIAHHARERALAEHTYAVRMRRMLEYIYPVRWIDRCTARRHDPDLARLLLAEISPDHDLYPLLKSWEPESKVTIQGLLEGLAGAPGQASRQELTLRWMERIIAGGQRQ